MINNRSWGNRVRLRSASVLEAIGYDDRAVPIARVPEVPKTDRGPLRVRAIRGPCRAKPLIFHIRHDSSATASRAGREAERPFRRLTKGRWSGEIEYRLHRIAEYARR